jgi:transposase InsO family protein
VPTWSGFVYVAFVIDLFSRAIVGWQASTIKDTAFVEACLRMALWRRDQMNQPIEAGLIHHSDAGSYQPVSAVVLHRVNECVSAPREPRFESSFVRSARGAGWRCERVPTARDAFMRESIQ